MSTHHDPADPFGPVLFTYSRADALADGIQVEVTPTAQEAGIRFPVFLTRAVWDHYVTVPAGVSGQDEAGRLWDLVWMLRFAILRSKPGTPYLPVALYVRNDPQPALPREAAPRASLGRLIKLLATCGPRDHDDPRPAITLMLPGED